MFNLLAFYFFSFILGAGAILFSVLFWRIKTEIFFWLGLIFTLFLGVLYAYNYQTMLYFISNSNEAFSGLVLLAFFFIPIYFLIKSKINTNQNTHNSEVTDDYLNEIINSPDDDEL